MFDAEFLRSLERLRVALRRRAAVTGEGDRPSARPGGVSVHLAHRPYVPGDDFRSIDWNAYARLGALYVRERERERAVRLHVVLDASASMAVGGKLECAKRIAAALGVIAEAEGGEAVLWSGRSGPLTLALVDGVREGPPASALAASVPRGAVAVVIGDPWDDAVPGAPGTLIHILAREEIDPPARGVVRLVDSETGEAVERYVSEAEVAEYRRLLKERCDRWRERAHEREVGYVRCAADDRLEDIVKLLAREGVLE